MGKKSGGRMRVKQVGPKNLPPNPMDALIPPEDMINLPPKRDSNITHVWPIGETFSMDYKSFHAIYPTYIDANKTAKLGRRIATKDAVPDPSVFEISEALQLLRIRHALQPHKGYSRDAESRWFNPGRVLVDLEVANSIMSREDDGGDGGDAVGFDVDDLPDLDDEDENQMSITTGSTKTKRWLMKQIAARVPNLASRKKRLQEKKEKEQEEAEKQAEKRKKHSQGSGSGNTTTKASTKNTSSSKKKGKKKR